MNYFIQLWLPSESDFVKYFIPSRYVYNDIIVNIIYIMYYIKYKEKWEKCYHHFDHGDTDTSMFLERYCLITASVLCILY